MKFVPMKVTLLRTSGTDLDVVNAARVSFEKESEEFSTADASLIRYLARHNHWTPMAHVGATFRIKAPLFVARQLGKHQVGLVWNEVSRRYVDSPPEFFQPDSWRGRAESVKQGSGGDLSALEQFMGERYLQDATQAALQGYEDLLGLGVAPEQARMVLPQNTMTEWIWTGSLAAWARVCKLRLDTHAQKEVRDIAALIHTNLEPAFPATWAALMEN